MPSFQITLGTTIIQFDTVDQTILQLLDFFFGSLALSETAVPHITCTLQETELHNIVPMAFDYYDVVVGFGIVKTDTAVLFHFDVGAWISVDLEQMVINGRLHTATLPHLEEIIYLTLSPLLRRRQHYLAHGFAAQKDGETILIIGDSGSGKTTAGLTLLLDGWRFLSNDTILLGKVKGHPIAYPNLDNIRIREGSNLLLDPLHEAPLPTMPIKTSDFLNNYDVIKGESDRVTAVYFITLTPDYPTTIQPLPKALALAKLMEASLDRWDTATLSHHVTFLKQLCEGTAVYSLSSGQNIHSLPDLLLGT